MEHATRRVESAIEDSGDYEPRIDWDNPDVQYAHKQCRSAYDYYLLTHRGSEAPIGYYDFYFGWSAERIAINDRNMLGDLDEAQD